VEEYAFNCNNPFKDVTPALLDLVKRPETNWVNTFGIKICPVDRAFFQQFEHLDRLMTEFKCRRHSVFRFDPHTSYGWHIDNPGRSCALNMRLEGANSHTFCGKHATIKENDDYVDVQEVRYEDDKFVLLNVHKSHTVFNLNNVRYVLSISFRPEYGDFKKIKQYLIENNF